MDLTFVIVAKDIITVTTDARPSSPKMAPRSTTSGCRAVRWELQKMGRLMDTTTLEALMPPSQR